ncbi:MAG: DUF1080 domain-containing protein [Bacteroidales bacterium]|nr:DUF1080 domain-containing protein [Bacteroidales bacterium]
MIKKYFIPVLLIVLSSVMTSCTLGKTDKPDWKYLFNGNNLDGWVQMNGEAPYTVMDSVIVGTTVVNSPNSFLCTEQNYGDFILELEFKVNPEMNSGVQIRSLSLPEYQNGRVHGYQIEIDPSERAWTGGIYDEGRTGWLYPLNDDENAQARTAFKNGEWNKFRVEAIGNSIKTWVNGIPVANLYADITASGFIALQVHSIGSDTSKAGEQIMWKNIRIITENPIKFATVSPARVKSYLLNTLTDEEIDDGWKLLFDGKTSNGWRKAYADSFPSQGWKIENGELTVLASGGGESQNGGDIVTLDEYSNFELDLQFKITPGANSGVKYFVTEKEKNNPGSAIGLEYQILDDKLHPDAKLGNHEGSRTLASLYDLIAANNKRENAMGEWNNLRLISRGTHVEHWLNGFKVLEYERGSPEFRKLVAESKYAHYENFGEAEKGHLLLQDHGFLVSFRSIKVKEFEK